MTGSGVLPGLAVLRPYQRLAVDAVCAGLAGGGSGQVRMACGTGKTLVASRVSGELAGVGVTAVLVPSLALAAQTLAAWPAGSRVDAAIAVCSDSTVADSPVRAADLRVPVTTAPGEIARFLAAAVAGGQRVLAVATYDSAGRLAEGLRLAGVRAELTVCDEAHWLAGPSGKDISAVLEDGWLPDRRRLYMTATPRIVTRRRADGELAGVSMDDEAVFGPVLAQYSFPSAIAEGWLADYRIVIAAVTSEQAAQLLHGEQQLARPDGVPLAMAAAQAALAMAAREFGLRRCLVFTSRVEAARQFTMTLPATLAILPQGRRPAGQLAAAYAHGGMTAYQRGLVLDHLRHPPDGGWSVVANARCLSEGVDVPATDGVLFAAPRSSVTDIVQAAGRALRPKEDGGTATIIVPVLLPHAGGSPAAGEYRTVLKTVRALCAHDQTLADQLDTARLRHASGPAGSAQTVLPPRFAITAPDGAAQQTLDALRLHIVHTTTSSWWDGYAAARRYHDRHGHLDMPASYADEQGVPAGAWLISQRHQKDAGTLPARYTELLDQIGMPWDLAGYRWHRTWQEARDFHREHGHLRVPDSYRTPTRTPLCQWLSRQAAAAAAGTLTQEQARLWEQIGAPVGRDQRWHAVLEELAAFRRTHGHWQVPAGTMTAAGTDLSQWVRTQRIAHEAGTMPAWREALLDAIGFPWDPAEQAWQDQYAGLVAFIDEQGPGNLRAHGGARYTWLRRQLRAEAAGNLTPDHARLLRKLDIPPPPSRTRPGRPAPRARS